VVDNDDILIGIVTFNDILKHKVDKEDWDKVLVENIMVKDVKACRQDEDALVVFEYFILFGFGRIPIIDEHNKIVGIVSRKDIPAIMKMILNPPQI